MIDPAALQMVLRVLTGWLERLEREAIAYVIEENRLLRRQRGTRRLRLTDDDRRRPGTLQATGATQYDCDHIMLRLWSLSGRHAWRLWAFVN